MKNALETTERSSISFLDKSLIVLSFIPVVFSILRLKIVQSIGYVVFLLGGIFPELHEKIVSQQIPQNVKTLLRVHIIAHSLFGQFLGFYDLIPFLDKGLHFMGSLLGVILFYFIVSTDSKFWEGETRKKRAVFLSFLLANFAGIIWEIAEFISDKLFKLGAQKGLEDTMFDLIFNLLGAYLGGRLLIKTQRGLIHGK
ncbi:MAG TPA: hypothetical protein VIL29_10860 [Pseudothermotoga sp.]